MDKQELNEQYEAAMTDFPDYYDPGRIGRLFYPDMNTIAAEAAVAGLAPAANDKQIVHLLLVDMQIDFCHEQGSLYVPGALDDIRRVIEFIFRHAEDITGISCTLDSHLPFQIFHAPWWVDEDGNHPDPLTIITHEDVKSGKWQPLVMPEYSVEYVRKLEAQAKKRLTIWPYHVLIGSMGNSLDPELLSAVQWHAIARKTQPAFLRKGTVPESEHYSSIQPEFIIPDHPQGGKHEGLLDTLTQADYVLVAGEAESHCVLETLEDLVDRLSREQLEKIYVLQDCTSPVQHPEVDFHAIAMEAFAEFDDAGINFVNSTDDLDFLMGEKVLAETAESAPAPVHGLQRMGQWVKQKVEA